MKSFNILKQTAELMEFTKAIIRAKGCYLHVILVSFP